MRQLLAAFATGLFFLAAPAFGQDRIPVATLNGETIWLDEILAIAETLPPEYQQAGLPGLYPQLIDEVANARLSAAAGRAARAVARQIHQRLGGEKGVPPQDGARRRREQDRLQARADCRGCRAHLADHPSNLALQFFGQAEPQERKLARQAQALFRYREYFRIEDYLKGHPT